jgi:hypothetical protein
LKEIVAARCRKRRSTAVGTRCADHTTSLYSQYLALTSPTGSGRSVGIVRLQTKAMEVRFEVLTAVTMKNVVFWSIRTQFMTQRRHITSPLQSPAS